ncbi:sigma-70 family RNA polymerase sigma factor [Mucilaginibacter flavus]|uniref:sigma-70 family RNA polymerase sigma factor n=1 Tax=Mucilaginibacter flavus TaxID=931504 RepID=UPI0025B551A5|nr:sigma-70 family RNA polymerase sigma factor [Mucilaginibacter flavus]MDN3581054.1 sigma-70 family RNA polymerase sigma factor [Mucilaginibacter flavus]
MDNSTDYKMLNDPQQTRSAGEFLIDPHQWVDKYADYLYTYAFTRTNNEDKARDLVQETFLAALEHVDSFESRSSEKTWLTAILKNKVIDNYRKASSGLAKKTVSLDADTGQTEFFVPDYNNWRPEQVPKAFGLEDDCPMLNKELNSILQRCLEKLPSQWLAVFTMKHMDDEKTDDICEKLNVTTANFWVIIHRTKLNLRACLQRNWN